MLPGQGDARQMFGLSYEGPKREDYLSVQAAQVTVSFPIVPLAPAVGGLALKNVHVERCCGNTPTQISLQQQVQSWDGSWILLSQRPPSADSSGIQWGIARYDWEAQQVDLGGRTAYVLQRFGWWYVDWEINRMSFELQAPATLGQPNLLRIARKIIAQ